MNTSDEKWSHKVKITATIIFIINCSTAILTLWIHVESAAEILCFSLYVIHIFSLPFSSKNPSLFYITMFMIYSNFDTKNNSSSLVWWLRSLGKFHPQADVVYECK